MLNYFPLFRWMAWIADNSLSDYSVACMHWSSLSEEMLLSFCSFLLIPLLAIKGNEIYSPEVACTLLFSKDDFNQKTCFRKYINHSVPVFLFAFSIFIRSRHVSGLFQNIPNTPLRMGASTFRRSNRLSKPLEISKDLQQSETDPRRWPIVRVLVR